MFGCILHNTIIFMVKQQPHLQSTCGRVLIYNRQCTVQGIGTHAPMYLAPPPSNFGIISRSGEAKGHVGIDGCSLHHLIYS